MKLVISTNASLVASGPDIIKKRNEIVYDDAGIPIGIRKVDKAIPAPRVISDIFNCLNIIIANNQNRQGT